MRNVSSALAERMRDNTTLVARGSLLLASGSRVELGGTDVFSLSFESATSSDSQFDVGAAVMGTLDVTLNNWDGRYDSYDFTGATLTAFVGAPLPDGTTEWVQLGVFDVDQPDSYSGRVQLSCLDNLSRMERPLTDVDRPLPCTAQELAQAICDRCGVVLMTPDIPNGSYVVGQDATFDSTDTCLDAIGWVAQLTGTFARCDSRGRLVFAWYGGGVAGDDGAPAEGAECEALRGPTSLKVMTDDVVVTGVRVTAQNQETEEGVGKDGETALSGKEGYVLELGGNKLVTYGRAAEVAGQVGARVVGMRFRPFEAACLTSLSLEAGDAVVVTDVRGSRHASYATRVCLTANSAMTVSCAAEPAARNSATTSASAATKAAVDARNDLLKEREARLAAQLKSTAAIESIANQIATAGGLYSTAQGQSDGSTVWYMHDRPHLAESASVWKFSADTISVSSDGMKTWSAALNASGTAVLERIYAVGIDADHITGGRISSRDGASYIDLDTGAVRLSSSVVVGDRELSETIAGINENVDELFRKTSYVTVGQDDDGSPVLMLGTNVSDFSVQITNTAIRFMQGSQAIAYITNQQLYIQSSVITDELRIGGGTGFVWKRRTNGHLGLRYVG